MSQVFVHSEGRQTVEGALLVLHPTDNVAVARIALDAGAVVRVPVNPTQSPLMLTVWQTIPPGHKVALQALAPGDAVRRYGQTIGFATQVIQPGEHVHSHNLDAQGFQRDYAFGADVQPVDMRPESERRIFWGYKRPDGRVGTRNYIAVICTANCAAHVAREIAHAFTAEQLALYPNVDGVIAITHSFGCSTRIGGRDYVLLQRTLAGIATHPNVAASVFVGLGCEVNQVDALINDQHIQGCNLAGTMCDALSEGRAWPPRLIIQEQGGIRRTVKAGIAAIEELLPMANAVSRTPQPLSALVVGLQCGGSDSWSGVTANPVVGLVSDEVVRQGGTVVLGETTEIYGAEHLLTRRAITQAVGEKLLAYIRWWEEYAHQHGFCIDNNPTPGNKAGGLTTIYEKSLGAVAKAGSTPLMEVVDYAERISTPGLVFMNTPGNDWTSVTGLVAGGCTLVLFTTGRGSVFGFKPAPVIKVASHTLLYRHMSDDMDLNAGRVLEGASLHDVAAELLELLIAVASGQRSKSEAQGVGEAEFVPWQTVGVL